MLLADRAALTMDRHLKEAGTITSLDPYARPMRFQAGNVRMVTLAIARTVRVLQKHSLPSHLLNALLRARSPEALAQTKLAEEQIAREKLAEWKAPQTPELTS